MTAAFLLLVVQSAAALMNPLAVWSQRSMRERLALAPSPFAVAQSFSPRVFDNTLPLSDVEATLDKRVTITAPIDKPRVTDFVLAAANMEPTVAISYIRSNQGLRLVARGTTHSLQSIVKTVSRHCADGVEVTWCADGA